MKVKIKKLFNLTTFLIIAILFLGFYLRAENIKNTPREGATHDEYAWTWLGINLIQNGKPTSWSPHPQYKNRQPIVYHNAPYNLVTPYLEHPPIFGLVAGGYALLAGADNMYDVNISTIRGLSLILGTLSILLLFILTRKLYDDKTALIASFLYSIIPTIVIGSRIVQNENFLIPVWLLILIITHEVLKKNRILLLILIGLLCGLLSLAKVPWLAVTFSVLIIFLYNKKYKEMCITAVISLALFSSYFLYGYLNDWSTFIALWGLQVARYDIGFTSIFALFQKPYMVDRFFLDGWIYWGWFAYILLLTKNFKKNLFVISAVLSYFLIFVAGIPDEPGHGWYRYPFYPFLAISTAIFLRDYFVKNWLLTFFFLVIVSLPLLSSTWEQIFGFSYLVFRGSLILFGLTLIPQFIQTKNTIKLGKISAVSCIILICLMNIIAILRYSEI